MANKASPPTPPRRGRGVVSRGNGGDFLRVNWGWRWCWLLMVELFGANHRVKYGKSYDHLTQITA